MQNTLLQVLHQMRPFADGDTAPRDGTESRIQAWIRRDLSVLAQVPGGIDQRFPGMGYHYRQLAKHVIEDRTSSMHHWLFMPMRAGRVFVAIGASHLGGDKGLLALLERDGYRATRIW